MRTYAEQADNVKQNFRGRFRAWVKRVPDLTRSERAVLDVLAKRADEDGVSSPRQDWIADDLGITVRSVKRAVANLLSRGLIEREFRYTKRGYRTSNSYRIRWERKPENCPAKSTSTRGHSEASTRGQNVPNTYLKSLQVCLGDSGYTSLTLSVLAEEVEVGGYVRDAGACAAPDGFDGSWDAEWRLWQ